LAVRSRRRPRAADAKRSRQGYSSQPNEDCGIFVGTLRVLDGRKAAGRAAEVIRQYLPQTPATRWFCQRLHRAMISITEGD
jgi:hypothetical protein